MSTKRKRSLLHASLAILSTACGGAVTSADAGPGDAATDGADAPPADAPSDLGACAFGCYQSVFSGQQSSCPVLLLDSSCLDGKCDLSVSTTLCGGGNGDTPPDVASVECARTAFPQCPNVCSGEPACKAFVTCIEGCR